MTAPPPLEPGELYHACDESRLAFDTTAELDPLTEVLGQPRALAALHFGTEINSDGFNIFALGTSGTGKFHTVKQILEQQAAKHQHVETEIEKSRQAHADGMEVLFPPTNFTAIIPPRNPAPDIELR